MKKTILFSALFTVITLLTTGCQKRAVCMYMGSGSGYGDKVRIYSGDFSSAAAYQQAIIDARMNGFVCEEKDVSSLIK